LELLLEEVCSEFSWQAFANSGRNAGGDHYGTDPHSGRQFLAIKHSNWPALNFGALFEEVCSEFSWQAFANSGRNAGNDHHEPNLLSSYLFVAIKLI
jgi:hypothetical protein